MGAQDFDVVVIGSGFGGSVATLRLAEKGYRVAVIEAGRRFDDPAGADPRTRHRALPRNSWHTRQYLWAPRLGLTGIQRIQLLRGRRGARVLVLAGAGVGGGSLVYANTLYEPPRPFFEDPQWRHITDWEAAPGPLLHPAHAHARGDGQPHDDPGRRGGPHGRGADGTGGDVPAHPGRGAFRPRAGGR